LRSRTRQMPISSPRPCRWSNGGAQAAIRAESRRPCRSRRLSQGACAGVASRIREYAPRSAAKPRRLRRSRRPTAGLCAGVAVRTAAPVLRSAAGRRGLCRDGGAGAARCRGRSRRGLPGSGFAASCFLTRTPGVRDPDELNGTCTRSGGGASLDFLAACRMGCGAAVRFSRFGFWWVRIGDGCGLWYTG